MYFIILGTICCLSFYFLMFFFFIIIVFFIIISLFYYNKNNFALTYLEFSKIQTIKAQKSLPYNIG